MSEAKAVTDEKSAVDRVFSLLEEPQPTEGEEKKKPKANQEPEPEEQVEETETEEEESESEEASSEETEEAEPEGENEELPDTIESFAEALGVDPGELAGHLKVSVKVNGRVQNVTLAEAMKGYQLESDYRQKTAELAEQRRSLDAERQESMNRYQQQLARLDEAVQTAESLVAEQPSADKLAELLENDPQEYLRQASRIEAQKARLQKAREARDSAWQEAQEKHRKELTDFRREQQRLLSEKMPDVRDPEKLRAFETAAASTLRDIGFSEEEINGFFSGPFDHRQVLLIADAVKYRRMEKGKTGLAKKLSATPKVQKPGAARRPDSEGEKLQVSKERLRSLGKKGKTARRSQERAAVEMVKNLI